MKTQNLFFIPVSIVAISIVAGCQSNPRSCCPSASAETKTPAPQAISSNKTVADAMSKQTIRINAGATEPYTDLSGNIWLPDQGFEGGEIYERDSYINIANTKDAPIYRRERFSMNSFSQKVPNGNYLVKLHFAETFEGVEGPGQRVFSFNVEGHEVKDFDVFAKAGGSQRALIESINANVSDGRLDITFTSQIENPEINGIEIIPQL